MEETLSGPVHTHTVVETHRFAFHDLRESSYLWARPGESMIGIFLLRGPRPQLQATEEGERIRCKTADLEITKSWKSKWHWKNTGYRNNVFSNSIVQPVKRMNCYWPSIACQMVSVLCLHHCDWLLIDPTKIFLEKKKKNLIKKIRVEKDPTKLQKSSQSTLTPGMCLKSFQRSNQCSELSEDLGLEWQTDRDRPRRRDRDRQTVLIVTFSVSTGQRSTDRQRTVPTPAPLVWKETERDRKSNAHPLCPI